MILLALITIFIQTTMCEVDRRIITTLKYATNRVQPTIVNGEPVSSKRVPYLVSIKEPTSRISADTLLWANLCGGSIISHQRVLTAAHCFEGNNYYYAHHPEVLRVMAGNNHTEVIHTGSEDTTPDVQVRKIKGVVLNRDFMFPSNDIALVFTDLPWNYTEFVNYIVIARRTVDYPSTCIAAGYGKVSHGPRARDSPILLLARIRVMSKWTCSRLWQMDMSSFVCSDSVIGDVGRGDSGGPLICFDTSDPAEVPGKGLLVGIVSGKNYDKTTLYTRVSSFQEWIDTDNSSKLSPTLLISISLLLIYLLFPFESN